jgi:hypothetical protein
MRIDVELAEQQLQDMLGHRVGHLEAHRRAEAAARELALHGLE